MEQKKYKKSRKEEIDTVDFFFKRLDLMLKFIFIRYKIHIERHGDVNALCKS